MTTKEHDPFLKKNQIYGPDYFRNDKSRQFSTFNLNHIHKCLSINDGGNDDVSLGHSNSKSNNDKKFGKRSNCNFTKFISDRSFLSAYCSLKCFFDDVRKRKFRKIADIFVVSDYTDNYKKKVWNKSLSKKLSLKTLKNQSLNVKFKEAKNHWKNDKNISNNKNSSTLSLHIAAYENSDKVLNEFEDSPKKSKTFKYFDSLSKLKMHQDHFEFPRQMDGIEQSIPYIMQFKASQKLFSPNQGISLNQLQPSSDTVMMFLSIIFSCLLQFGLIFVALIGCGSKTKGAYTIAKQQPETSSDNKTNEPVKRKVVAADGASKSAVAYQENSDVKSRWNYNLKSKDGGGGRGRIESKPLRNLSAESDVSRSMIFNAASETNSISDDIFSSRSGNKSSL